MEIVHQQNAPDNKEVSDEPPVALTVKFKEMRISDEPCAPDEKNEEDNKEQPNLQRRRRSSRTSRANAVLLEMMSAYGLFPGSVTGKRSKLSVRGKAHFHCSKNKTSWTSFYGWAVIDLSRGRVVKWFGQGCNGCGTVCSFPYMKTEDFKDVCIFAIEKYLTPGTRKGRRSDQRKQMPAHKSSLCEKCSFSKTPCNGRSSDIEEHQQEDKENEPKKKSSSQLEAIKEIGEEVKKLSNSNVEKKAPKKNRKKKASSDNPVLGELQNLAENKSLGLVESDSKVKGTEDANTAESGTKTSKGARRKRQKSKVEKSNAPLPKGYVYIGDPPGEAADSSDQLSSEQKEKVWNNLAQDLKAVLKSNTLIADDEDKPVNTTGCAEEVTENKNCSNVAVQSLKTKAKKKRNKIKKEQGAKEDDADKENESVSTKEEATGDENLSGKDKGEPGQQITPVISKGAQRRRKRKEKERASKSESDVMKESDEVGEKGSAVEIIKNEEGEPAQDAPTVSAADSKKRKSRSGSKKGKAATTPEGEKETRKVEEEPSKENVKDSIANSEKSEGIAGKSENSKEVTRKSENSKEVTGKIENSKEVTGKIENSKEVTGKIENSKEVTGKSEDSKEVTEKSENNEVVTGKNENAEEQLKDESVAEEPPSKKEKKKRKPRKRQEKKKQDPVDSKSDHAEGIAALNSQNCSGSIEVQSQDGLGSAEKSAVVDTEASREGIEEVSVDEGPDSQFTKKLLSFMDDNDE